MLCFFKLFTITLSIKSGGVRCFCSGSPGVRPCLTVLREWGPDATYLKAVRGVAIATGAKKTPHPTLGRRACLPIP